MAFLSSSAFTSGLFAVVLVTCQYGSLVTSSPAATVAGRDTILHYSINEELAVGSIVANLQEQLSDDVNRTSLTYEVFRGDYSDYFYVDSPSGLLRIARIVDRDKICYKQTECVVQQDVAIVRPVQHFRIFKLAITIVDLNDNSPHFEQTTMTLFISESIAPGSMFMLPVAVDHDQGQYDIQSYELRSNDTANRFQRKVGTGSSYEGVEDEVMMIVTGKLDREKESVFRVELTAKDGGSPVALTGMIEIIIIIQDANDNSPVFDQQSYNVTVREDFPVNGVLVSVRATDADVGPNGQVVYSFSRQTSALYGDLFVIDADRGSISLRRRLDYETMTQYVLSVSAADRGGQQPDGAAVATAGTAGSTPSYARIFISVEDRNDNSPIINVNALNAAGVAEIMENQPIGSFTAHISVKDIDTAENGLVKCELLRSNDQFLLQTLPAASVSDKSVQYQLISNTIFDRETRSEYSLTLHCHDNGVPSLSSSRDLIVAVLDDNDNAPQFDRKSYAAAVNEGLPVGQPLVRLAASDADLDENAVVEFQLCPEELPENRQISSAYGSSNAMFSIDRRSGLVTTNVVLDYESTSVREAGGVVEVCLEAADRAVTGVRLTSTTTLKVTVIDVNDCRPVFSLPTYAFGTFENQPAGTEIGRVQATDQDSEPFNKFQFSIVQEIPALNAFTIDTTSGMITTTRQLDREQTASHQLLVTVADTDRPELTSQVNVTVFVADKNDNAPVISFPSPENSTFQVSRYAPVGYVITRIYARDADYNARLSFQLLSGNTDSLFDIDPQLGTISVGSDRLRQSSTSERHQLLIGVSDAGSPPLSATVMLTVLLTNAQWSEQANRHMSAKGGHVDDDGDDVFDLFGLGHHWLILVVLVCATGLIVVLLIAAIFCVKCRQMSIARKKRAACQYNVVVTDINNKQHSSTANNQTSLPDNSKVNVNKFSQQRVTTTSSQNVYSLASSSNQNTSVTASLRQHDQTVVPVSPDSYHQSCSECCEETTSGHIIGDGMVYNVPLLPYNTTSRCFETDERRQSAGSKVNAAVYQLPVTSFNDATMTSSRPQYNNCSSYHDHQYPYTLTPSTAATDVVSYRQRRNSLPHDTDTSSGCSSTANDVPFPSPPDLVCSRPPILETDLDLVINDLDRISPRNAVNGDTAFDRCSNIVTSSQPMESSFSAPGTSIDDVTETDHFLPDKTGSGSKMMKPSKRHHRPPPLPPPRRTSSLVQQ